MKKPMMILLAVLLVGGIAYLWYKRKPKTTTTAIKEPTDVFGDNLNTGMVNVVGKTPITEDVAANRWNLV